MSRTSRVPYHQNVYDLLQIEPGECPEAARMIAEHEAAHGPLPASVREWYLVPNMVPLTFSAESWARDTMTRGTIWYEHSDDQHQVVRLDELLENLRRPQGFPAAQFVRLLENQASWFWYLRLNGSGNPPVWCDYDMGDDPQRWAEVAPSFSAFTTSWFANYYPMDFTPVSDNSRHARSEVRGNRKVYSNGLWLRTPAEPFAAPIIDFLIEQFGEAERTPRPGSVTTYTYRPDGGTIRVTADDPAHPEPLSAWWVHADTSERLAEFASLLLPWGTLRNTLCADTNAARAVLQRVQAGNTN